MQHIPHKQDFNPVLHIHLMNLAPGSDCTLFRPPHPEAVNSSVASLDLHKCI
jgi:hypothetical protein